MANWAKLQEDLVGLPVAKRAKHGIHFQKGANEFVANFSGKPCHYEDGGIWKPIDTKLLATSGGFYGSPHSDVKIHPDGRVKVDKSDYQQFTKLPSAKAGKLVGDRIIRTFPGGEQHLIMTEDGFKEEIHVFKPAFPLEKFIAKTQGSLPSKYKAHPVTAEDAAGNTYEFTGDVKAFGAWLEKAIYPVVIDPDFTGTSSGGDNWLKSGNPTYNFGSYVYYNSRALMRFDLSSISSGSICNSATLSLKPAESASAKKTNLYKITDANGDWIEGTKTGSTAGAGEPCWNAKKADGSGGVTTAWAGSAGLSTAGTDYVNTVLATYTGDYTAGTYIDVSFNNDGLAVLADWFGNATNNGFLIIDNSGKYMRTKDNQAQYRPILTVTYTAASTAFVNILDHTNSVILGGSIVR